MQNFNNEATKKLATDLKPGEAILWWAQPEINLFSWFDVFIIPFTCLWASAPIGAIVIWSRDYLLYGKK